MELSRRVRGLGGPNRIARARAELTERGVRLTDLTDTNPTRHGLLSDEVLEALAQATRSARLYDPSPRGPVAAREALAQHFGGHPDQYWLTASTSEAYGYLLSVLTDPGDGVGIPAPGYPLLEPLAQLAGARLRRYPWHYLHPDGWVCDTAALRSLPSVRALVAVNPGNPTGAYVAGEARTALVAACERQGATLIADEVFYPFSFPVPDAGAHQPLAPAARLAGEEAVVTCALDGLSKALAAPGLKLGWMRVTGPRGGVGQLAQGLDLVADTYLSVGGPVAAALPQLLPLAGAVQRRIRERLGTNMRTARQVFTGGSYRVRAAQGGWMVLVDVARVMPDEDVVIELMRRAHLAVHPGWFYDLPREGTLALSLLPAPAQFQENCIRLVGSLDALA